MISKLKCLEKHLPRDRLFIPSCFECGSQFLNLAGSYRVVQFKSFWTKIFLHVFAAGMLNTPKKDSFRFSQLKLFTIFSALIRVQYTLVSILGIGLIYWQHHV